jgi:hypothetical protein
MPRAILKNQDSANIESHLRRAVIYKFLPGAAAGPKSRRIVSFLLYRGIRGAGHFLIFVVTHHRYHNISLLVSCFDIPVGLDNFLERICPIDDRLYLSPLYEILEEDEVFGLREEANRQ